METIEAMITMEAANPMLSESPKTAVVVDDSASSRRILSAMLTANGFRVVGEGERGDQALTLYEQHKPTILTLDIVLPIMDGVTAAQGLMAKHPGAMVMMCSSISAREKILACREAGVSHFLLKPFNLERVTAIVHALVERSKAAPAPIRVAV